MEKLKKSSYYFSIGLLIFLGTFWRTKLFILNNIFSDDECRLALSLADRNLIQSLFFLGNAQSAPPLFIFLSKIILTLSNGLETAAKFIPYISGIGAIILFYKVSNYFFEKRISKIASLFIFVISQPLIVFSTIFKQYSTDVFIALLCTYLFYKIKIKDFNKRELTYLSLSIMALPLISLPSLFFIGAFVIKNIFENFHNKNFYKNLVIVLLPFTITMIGYYIFNLAPAKADLYKYFPNYWDDGFWNLSLKELTRLLVLNFKFYFVPNILTLPALILFLWGAGIYIKEKKYDLVIATVLVLFASLLKLYPLSGRVGLYFIPIVILLTVKPLDSKKIVYTIFAGLLIFISFCKYDFKYLNEINKFEYFISYSPKTLTQKLTERFNPKSDIIICNSASSSSYLYYSEKQNFYTNNVYEMPSETKNKIFMFNYLNGLKKGQKYWLYLVKDYNKSKIFPFIFEWLDGKKVLYRYKDRNSYLIYVEN